MPEKPLYIQIKERFQLGPAYHMTHIYNGNIFDSPAQVITNTVNCVGVMGKGLALEFRNRFPEMFENYKQRCDRGQVRPGEPYLWENAKTQILNFPTKRHWKDDSLLDDIEAGLRYLPAYYQEMGIYTLALPPLGCGNGNLKWQEVRPLIVKHLGSLEDLEVFVYEPIAQAGQKNPWDQEDTQPSYPRPLLTAQPHRMLDK